MSRTLARALVASALTVLVPAAAGAVTNPDISVIGQPFVGWTDDPNDPDRLRFRPDIGEMELVFDAALNPYARGFVTLTIHDEGLEIEEGVFRLLRGLPFDLALKGGQYRVGFGRQNVVHPHANPFAERFGVLAAYLPGEEALIETGASLSRRFGIGADNALEVTLDWLQGDAFRLERAPTESDADPIAAGGDDGASLTRPAYAARLAGFTMLGTQSALEVGASAAGGTNNVAARARTRLYGVDAKAKLWTSENSFLLVQGEFLALDREEAAWGEEAGYTSTTTTTSGGYLYADYNWNRRWNVGASYERFALPEPGEPIGEAWGLFLGRALMEETTVIRADWRWHEPGEGDGYGRMTLRVIFSMGPHKPHQF
jgi:hypothetical protein